MDFKSLFKDHLTERRRALDADLEAVGRDAVIISSGAPFTYFADDNDAPFFPTPHFNHWCPMNGPHHLLHLGTGRKPRLIRYIPEDYWYEQAPLGDPFWVDGFDVVEAGTVDAVWAALGSVPNAAFIGNETVRAESAGLECNPGRLTSRLDWGRSYKTDYELSCLEQATATAARGHIAARQAFEAGASELDIHHAFVTAAGVTDDQLPYPSIVAVNEKGATLHYHGKRNVREGKVLLIDVGARHSGYASDITRTYRRDGAASAFAEIVDGLNAIQLGLCGAVEPGVPFGDLHHRAHLEIAGLLEKVGVIRANPEEAVREGWSRAFFPHGLGHHLGIQVHDVAGHQSDADGTPAPPPEQHSYLRNTRTLEERHCFTVEPGIYFIDMLLRPLREGEDSERFDWKLIDELSPCGGARIEDDIVVTGNGHRNLTTEHLPH